MIFFDTITHSILIFKLRKYGMYECDLKNGCTARVNVYNNQWLNIQLKASNKWSATAVQYCSMSSSMIWIIGPGECTLRQIQDDREWRKVIDIPRDKALTQTDFEKHENRANKNFLKFSREKRRVLCLEWNNPMHQHRLRTEHLGLDERESGACGRCQNE